MVIKQSELGKKKINNIILFYGKNESLKKEKIEIIFQLEKADTTISFSEEEILKNKKLLFNEILNKSFFDDKKNIIINNSSDKIVNIILELLEINITDVKIILNAGILEKKSKLRNLFEKEKNTTCVAFYEDTWNDLYKLINQFLNTKKISLSQSNINLLINRCNSDRMSLINELNKIELFTKNQIISTDTLLKLTNLSENYSISELVDSFLSKNTKKMINIFNENNFKNEDSIIIIKTLLKKTIRLLKLTEEFKVNKNLELTIANFKPSIFWKEKDLIKDQIKKWQPNQIKEFIFKTNHLELLAKKNIDMSLSIISNFMIEQSSYKFNN